MDSDKYEMSCANMKKAAIIYAIVAIVALVIGWWYLRTANTDYADPNSQQCICDSKFYVWWGGFFLVLLAVLAVCLAIYLGYYMKKTC